MAEAAILEGRACGECTMCCRILGIDEIDKPQGAACPNCIVGGCAIYQERPQSCRDFYCGYLLLPMVDAKWFPERSGMVVYPAPEGNRLVIHVDPAQPDAWQGEPYYSEIKRWARHVAERDFQVLVCIGQRTIAVLPEEDVDLGMLEPGWTIVYEDKIEGGKKVRSATRRQLI